MKEIPLTQGKFAIVDDKDYDWLSKWKWCYNSGYAVRMSPGVNGKQRKILMHREILQTLKGTETDHINGDRLDNRRYNLRVCTHSQNMMNQRKTRGCSRFKGVHWHKAHKKWHAKIKKERKNQHIGYFDVEDNAALAYNEAATELFGEFASLNEVRI